MLLREDVLAAQCLSTECAIHIGDPLICRIGMANMPGGKHCSLSVACCRASYKRAAVAGPPPLPASLRLGCADGACRPSMTHLQTAGGPPPLPTALPRTTGGPAASGTTSDTSSTAGPTPRTARLYTGPGSSTPRQGLGSGEVTPGLHDSFYLIYCPELTTCLALRITGPIVRLFIRLVYTFRLCLEF